MNIRYPIYGFALVGSLIAGCAPPAAEEVEGRGSTRSKIQGARLTEVEIARVAKAAGVPCGESLVIAVAVAGGESDGYVEAYHYNAYDGSEDRGIWQINSVAWPGYDADCVYSAECNAEAMAEISNRGSSWTHWLAYTNGRYEGYLAGARAAVNRVCGGGGGGESGSGATCESIGYHGVCVGQTSIWAEDGQCRVRDCASEGKECGLISETVGLGCRGGTQGAKVSSCSAFGSAGRCFGDTKVWVDQGRCRWATMRSECQSDAR